MVDMCVCKNAHTKSGLLIFDIFDSTLKTDNLILFALWWQDLETAELYHDELGTFRGK